MGDIPDNPYFLVADPVIKALLKIKNFLRFSITYNLAAQNH